MNRSFIIFWKRNSIIKIYFFECTTFLKQSNSFYVEKHENIYDVKAKMEKSQE